MIRQIGKFGKDLFTTADGESGDVGRVLWALGVLVALVATAYVTFRTGAFDIQTFGIGFGVLLGAGAGALKLKESTETEKPTTPPAQP